MQPSLELLVDQEDFKMSGSFINSYDFTFKETEENEHSA